MWTNNVLYYEEIMLESLCFDLEVEIPHPACLLFCARLKASKVLTAAAYKYCSDW